MSLAMDQNLINELLKIAQAQPINPGGIAQSPTPTVLDPSKDPAASADQIREVAKKLIANLVNQKASSDEFTAEKDGAELNVKHLTHLSDLLNFLASNGISSSNGYKLVLQHSADVSQGIASGAGNAEFISFEPKKQAAYVKYPKGDANFQYYVYKLGLLQYIRDLQQQAAGNTPDARVLRPLLDKLINEANSQLALGITALPAGQTPGGTGQPSATGQPAGQAPGPEQGQGSGEPSQGSGLTAQQMQLIRKMGSQYPFLQNKIDFNLISQWLNMYNTLTSGTAMSASLQYISPALKWVNDIITRFGQTEQPLNVDATAIYRDIKAVGKEKGFPEDVARSFPSQYVQELATLIPLVNKTVLAFQSNYANSMPADWAGREALEDQIGNSGSALAAQTMSRVDDWSANIGNASRQVEALGQVK